MNRCGNDDRRAGHSAHDSAAKSRPFAGFRKIAVVLNTIRLDKGNLPVELLVSAGLGVLGTAAIFGSEGSGGLLLGLVGVPIAQIVFTVHQERAAEYSGR